MKRHVPDVTEAELAVLKVLWADGTSTIRKITEQLYPRQSESDYATVKKLLARLEDKRCVRRSRKQMAHEFTASITLDDLVERRLETLANDLCDGSRTPLLMNLLQSGSISNKQKQQLRKLIEDLSADRYHSTRQTKRRRKTGRS